MSLPPPLALDEAQSRLLAMVTPLGSEEIPAEQAIGRYLAAAVQARRTQPATDLSAMDGYAMRGDDASGPWRVVGESAAGHPFARALEQGQAIRISTGAAMPEGGGAVLLQEEATRNGEALRLATGGEATARHIRRAGFDFRTGDTLLTAGKRIGPAQLAAAISGGNSHVSVGRQPAIAIIDSGDELASDPSACGPNQIPASNGAMIAAMAAPFARRVTRIGPVPDRIEAVIEALEQAGDCDIIVTSGGASVGDHDLMRPTLLAWGAEIDFWRVAMKPGKPLMVSRKGRQLILGLPGNPVSSYVTAFMFLLPLLRAIAGAESPLPETLQLALSEALPGAGGRLEFIRARLAEGAITPVNEQDSSALFALSSANALIRREIHAPPAAVGDLVTGYLLENGGIL